VPIPDPCGTAKQQCYSITSLARRVTSENTTFLPSRNLLISIDFWNAKVGGTQRPQDEQGSARGVAR
jgi:hypothetical protein